MIFFMGEIVFNGQVPPAQLVISLLQTFTGLPIVQLMFMLVPITVIANTIFWIELIVDVFVFSDSEYLKVGDLFKERGGLGFHYPV